MKATSVVVSFAAACGAFLCLSSLSSSSPGHVVEVAAAAEAQATTQYHCPMHPTFTQDRKGDCPICGMKLVPVKASPGAATTASAPAAAGQPARVGQYTCPMHPAVVSDGEGRCPDCGMKLVRVEKAPGAVSAPAAGAIAVAAEKQKVLGMVTAPAERAGGARNVRAVGRVAPDETRLYRVNAGTGGSIREVAPVVTGSRVRKNQMLGSFYAPETITSTQLFILNTQGFARQAVHSVTEDPKGEKGEDEADVGKKNSSLYKANVQQRIIQMESFGISEVQREQIMKDGRVPDAIWIVSPADGFVLARNVSSGQKFERGFEFFRIADLRKVWVMADVFMQDARELKTGMKAQISVPEQGTTLPATIAEILPQFDPTTRTLKVRLDVENPGLVLRPDMFVDVTVPISLPPAVVVPADAVVDSGLAKTVFVRSGEGTFVPRKVETGWRSGNRVEIVSGLAPGEEVVVSGTFFLDSETRMRPTPSGTAAKDRSAPAPTGREQTPSGGAGPSPTGAAERHGHEEAAQARAGDAR
jgi:Cu(I)/Ag(I) efflux system membrane fusion protein